MRILRLRRVNKKIKKHLEEIEKDDEVIARFLDNLIVRESGKGKNWRYKKEYRKLIEKATEEWKNHAKN